MKKLIVFLNLIFIVSTSLIAQTYKYTTIPNDPYKIRKYVLSNGLTVFLGVNKNEPRIETMIAVKAGSKTDPPFNTGLAHYLEHLMFKGTDKYGTINYDLEQSLLQFIEDHYSMYNQTKDEKRRKEIYKLIDSVSGIAAKVAVANEYDNMMQALGATGTNAFTSNEMTVYVNNIPSNNINKWLTIEGERFRKPVFRLFHTELEAVYEEKNISLDNDSRKAEEALMSLMFKIHPYGTQTTIGTTEHLKNPNLKSIREYYSMNYVPNNMGIIMVGDFNPDEVIKMIDEKFSYMSPKPLLDIKFPAEEPIKLGSFKKVMGSDAAFLKMGYRLPGANTKEAIVMDLVSSILYNGVSGIMDVDLIKSQKVQSLNLSSYTLKDYSILEIMAKPNDMPAGQEEPSLLILSTKIYESIEKLTKGDFDESLIKAVIANKKIERIKKQMSSKSITYDVLDAFVTDVDWQTYINYLDEMSKITKQDIISFAKQYLDRNYALVVKLKGEDTTIKKVEKPSITPVDVNPGLQSNFFKDLFSKNVSDITPQFLDYNKLVSTKMLKNGIKLHYVKNVENELFKLNITFNLGKFNIKNLPFALGYLKYLGTDNLTSEGIAKSFYEIACEYDYKVTDRQTIITITGLQENIEKAINLIEDIFRNPKVDLNKYAEYQRMVRKSRMDAKQNKRNIMQALNNYAIYGPFNPFNYVLREDEISKQKPEELISLIKSIFSYEHTIEYFGPSSISKISKLISKNHKTISPWIQIPKAVEIKPIQNENENIFFVDYKMVQAEVQWVKADETFNPDNYSISSIFNEYYGGGMGSVVFQTIRESKALAYSCYMLSRQPEYKDMTTNIIAYVGTQADKLQEAIESMNELISKMPMNENLLTNVKASLKSQISSERVQPIDYLTYYNQNNKLGISNNLQKDLYNSIDNISIKSLEDYFNKHIAAKGYSLCLIASKDKIKINELSKFGRVTDVPLNMLFGY